MADSMTLPAAAHRHTGIRRSPFLARCTAISVLLVIALAGCGTMGRSGPSPSTPRGGGYYLDDGPGANPPADLDSIPDATPRVEPLIRGTMRPYVVMGKQYTPMTSLEPYRARGVATWYGRRYHGKQTSSGEIYDMYRMTAAHPVLPIPSYARVTNLRNGRSVVVRINDRGPFLDGREIDLSYVAAYKLGIIANGSGMVEVDSVIPGAAAPPVMANAPETDGVANPAVDSSPETASPAIVTTASEPVREVSHGSGTAQAPLTSDASGIYLQLGAFGSKPNAESFLARLQMQVAWLADTVHIYSRDGLYRVHAGPYASRDEARAVADRISQAFGIKSFVLTR
ncbi:MAG: septal ring lytic transglycosylase RlpA family protein [Burkholderiales bacterium]